MVHGRGEVGECGHGGIDQAGPADVERVGPDGMRETDVRLPVADHPRLLEVEAQRCGRGLGHTRPRLAVGAGPGKSLDDPIGVVGAEEPDVDVRTLTGQLGGHVLVHLLDVDDVVEAASDAGLVGDNGDRNLSGVQPGNGLDRAGYELDALDRPDVTVVDDDRAIPIKQDARSVHW